ncbi:MAG: FdtA/QdtA family cupin domain-containing protein [Marinobacter nauticus]
MEEKMWSSGQVDLIASLDNADDLKVSRCAFHPVPCFKDNRGTLSVLDYAQHVPFPVQRSFFLFDIAAGEYRGRHAHIQCQQFIFLLSGAVSIGLDDGNIRQSVRLDSPSVAISTAHLIWNTIYDTAPDAVLAVLASEPYDEADYIRSYDQFQKHVRSHDL